MRREAMICFVTVVALAVATFAGQGEWGEYRWDLPPGVPPPVPVDAPMTAARVELGRHLFYDTRLRGWRFPVEPIARAAEVMLTLPE